MDRKRTLSDTLGPSPKRMYSTPPPQLSNMNIQPLMNIRTFSMQSPPSTSINTSMNNSSNSMYSTPPPMSMSGPQMIPMTYSMDPSYAYQQYQQGWPLLTSFVHQQPQAQQQQSLLPPLPQGPHPSDNRPPPPPDDHMPQRPASVPVNAHNTQLSIKPFANLSRPIQRPNNPVNPPNPPNPPGTISKRAKKRQKAAAKAAEVSAHQSENPEIVTTVNKKSKRKPMATRYSVPKDWNLDDAKKALQVEMEFSKKKQTPMLIIKFPDPPIDGEIVKSFHNQISMVHFQQPCTPRYCFAQLAPGSDLETVKEELCKIKFGNGFLTAERKHQAVDKTEVDPEEIDPYTLYIGNIATTLSTAVIKQEFPNALRIDVGFAQKMKYTRYAFVRYQSVDEAIEAFKSAYNKTIAHRSIIVRFRRTKGTVGMSGEPAANKDSNRLAEEHDEEDQEVNDLELDDVHSIEPETEALDHELPEQESELSLVNIKEEPREEVDEEEELDSKEHVLEESQRMMANGNGTFLDPNVTVKTEPGAEVDNEDDDDDDYGNYRSNDNDEEDEESEERPKFELSKFLDGETWDSGKPDEEIKPNVSKLNESIIKDIKQEKDKNFDEDDTAWGNDLMPF